MPSPGLLTRRSGPRFLCLLAVRVMVVAATVSKGCEAPGKPKCFRNTSSSHEYTCEWERSSSATNVTYDLLISPTEPPFYDAPPRRGLRTNRIYLDEDKLIKYRNVSIVVTAHVGNASCTSNSTTVWLSTVVKLPEPVKMAALWSDHKLKLTWPSQGDSASAEVLVRHVENKTQTSSHEVKKETNVYSVLLEGLETQRAYQVQVRQRSTQVRTSFWSDWSANLTVPAEILQSPDVELKTITEVDRGIRQLVFTWKAVPPAAQAGGVNYTLTYPPWCLCAVKKKAWCQITVPSLDHAINVTNSAFNLSIRAENKAGASSRGYINVAAKPDQDLKACEKNVTFHGRHVEWYEFTEGGTAKERTLRKVPLVKPLSFSSSQTDTALNLSWQPIPLEARQGFISHYTLCHTKHTKPPEQEPSQEECRHLNASQTTFRLENLQPESRYNITLAGVTSVGSGPQAFLPITTFPSEKPPEGNLPVWISLGLLVTFFGASILCSLLVKRLKSKILPPVPEPVILSPALIRADNEELERRETLDEVSVHQPVLGGERHWFEDLEEDMDQSKTLIGTDEDQTQQGSRDSFESPGDQEEVLYRNGLVFDMKAEELRSGDQNTSTL
ncbi:interleukin-12 receptor subunit beta-1 isoform X2 [Gadus macrocephalus]|uniref:interleukin-12 receptor subunit beta-1 isoform X2 n=1 Tax=Gadus macrocephalus TaxID=80720 RepID=UPI0028CB5DE6|nr:interleukin-12 receptor subunit beta-1 isoform X2 [Gadus macrocephalus]